MAHYWLAVEMAQTVGLDLQGEIEAGRFSVDAWANVVNRCRTCTWAGDCPAWMAAHADLQPDAPATCVNADRFNALRTTTLSDRGDG